MKGHSYEEMSRSVASALDVAPQERISFLTRKSVRIYYMEMRREKFPDGLSEEDAWDQMSRPARNLKRRQEPVNPERRQGPIPKRVRTGSSPGQEGAGAPASNPIHQIGGVPDLTPEDWKAKINESLCEIFQLSGDVMDTAGRGLAHTARQVGTLILFAMIGKQRAQEGAILLFDRSVKALAQAVWRARTSEPGSTSPYWESVAENLATRTGVSKETLMTKINNQLRPPKAGRREHTP
jgi:hypothetical protein